ncbi:hypothetical protein [Lacibacter sp.]|uniref:hypothetical protein n=1 Tax=Lacibacter sp. TaxID=1915409 RepID=UPI002B4B0A5A|nr:hypothetical protein [Lacibacter sp.]HLP36956.1 hypothetical protein [Lacibacter sp.]
MNKANKLLLTDFRNQLFDSTIDFADIMDYTGRPMLITLPYLRKHGLLPFFPKGKWQLKINFVLLIWLRIIEKLRQFNYTVADMQKLCDYFFKDAYYHDLVKSNFLYNIDQLKKKELAGTISMFELNTLNFLQSGIEDEKLLYALKLQINYLSNLIIQCIDDRADTGLLVFTNGRIMEFDAGGYGNHNNEYVDVNEPHIHLSITYFLREFVKDEELTNFIMPRLLNENEQTVLKALNNKAISELVIKKQQDGELRIDTSKKGQVTGEQAKAIRQILGLGNYEEIRLSTRDKKTLSFVRTNKNINSD